MTYTRPAHGDPANDSSATDATVIIDALSDGLEAVEAQYSLAHGQSMYLMGDSIAAQCGVPAGGTTNGTTYTYDAMSWWVWAQAALGWRFEWLGNAGVGGTTTTTQVASQLPTVLASAASHVVWVGGINDLGASATPDPATTIAQLTSGYDQILAAGKVLVACTIYRSTPLSNAGQITAQSVVNQFIRRYARTNSNVILFDVSAIMTDPATGYCSTSLARDESGSYIHPGNVGSAVMGERLADLLSTVTTPASPLPGENSDSYNLCTNGLVSGTTGWSVSDGSGGALPGTSSVVARTDGGPGSLYEVTLTASGSDTGIAQLLYQNTNITSALYGDHVVVPRFYFEVGTAGGSMDWTNVQQFSCRAQWFGATGISYAVYRGGDTTTSMSATYFPRSGIFQCPAITVPASGVTRLQVVIQLATVSAGAGGGTFRVGNLDVHDLTACGY